MRFIYYCYGAFSFLLWMGLNYTTEPTAFPMPIINVNFNLNEIISAINETREHKVSKTKITPSPPPPPSQIFPKTPQESNVPNKTFESSLTSLHYCFQTLADHPFLVGLGAVTTAYAVSLCLLARYALFINNKANWCSWHRTLPLHELYQLDHDQAVQELIAALTSKYHSKNGSLSLIDLYTFEIEIDKELAILQNYLNFYNCIKKMYLSRLFPDQRKLRQQAKDNINRLEFLKKLRSKLLYNLMHSS